MKSPRVALQQVVRARAIGDSASYSLFSSFGASEYVITLVDIVNNGDGTVTVVYERVRRNNNAIADAQLDILVAGERIGGETTNFTSTPTTHRVTGAGQAGDTVTITASTDLFNGGSLTVTGVVPSVDGGDEPPTEEPTDGTTDGGTGDRRGLLAAVALIAAVGLALGRGAT